MKTLIFFLLFCGFCFAQTSTEKWNDYNRRYEYFDSNGNMTGYKTYNSYTQTWEYYKTENTQREIIKPYDFNTTYKVLEYKQNKFDANLAKIQNYITHMFDNLRQSDTDPVIINRVIRRFGSEAVDKIPTDTDLSQDYNTNLIMKWLYQEAKKIMISEGLLKQ